MRGSRGHGAGRARSGAAPTAHAGPGKGCGARAALRAAAGAHWRGPVAKGAPRRSLALRHSPPPRRRARSRSRDSGTAPTAEPHRRTPAVGRPRGPAAASRPGLPRAPHEAAHAPILLAAPRVTLPGAARAPHPPARLRRPPPPRPAPRPPAGRARRGVATRRPQGLPGRSASLFVRGGGGGAPPGPQRARGPRSPEPRPRPRPRPPPARRRRYSQAPPAAGAPRVPRCFAPVPPRAAPAPHLRSRPRSGGGPAAPGAPGPGPGPRAWWRRGAERTAPPDVTAPPGRGLAGRGRGLEEGGGASPRGRGRDGTGAVRRGMPGPCGGAELWSMRLAVQQQGLRWGACVAGCQSVHSDFRGISGSCIAACAGLCTEALGCALQRALGHTSGCAAGHAPGPVPWCALICVLSLALKHARGEMSKKERCVFLGNLQLLLIQAGGWVNGGTTPPAFISQLQLPQPPRHGPSWQAAGSWQRHRSPGSPRQPHASLRQSPEL